MVLLHQVRAHREHSAVGREGSPAGTLAQVNAMACCSRPQAHVQQAAGGQSAIGEQEAGKGQRKGGLHDGVSERWSGRREAGRQVLKLLVVLSCSRVR